MKNTQARLRLVQTLLQMDQRKPVEAQLRQKWLQELQQLKYIQVLASRDADKLKSN